MKKREEEEGEEESVVGYQPQTQSCHSTGCEQKTQQKSPVRSPGTKLPVCLYQRRQGGNPLLASRSPFCSLPLLPALPPRFFSCCCCCCRFFCACAVVYSAAGCPGAPVPGALRRADSLFCFLFFCPPPSERQRSAVRSLLSFSGSATELFCETFLANFLRLHFQCFSNHDQRVFAHLWIKKKNACVCFIYTYIYTHL